MIFKRFAVSFLITLLVYLPAFTQTPTPAQSEQKELEKKATALLDDVVNEAMSLRLVENRIYALTTAAELLWKHNKDRARSWLREAVNQFMAMEQPTEPDDPRTIQAFQIRMELRTQLLQMLAARDAPLALDFLRASRMPDAGKLLGSKGATPDFEQQFEMQLAVRIAENDPRTALQIAEESLREGLTHQVYEIWMNLIAKDSTTATKLSSEMLSKMKSSDLMKNYQSLTVAFSMLYHLRSQIQSAQKSAKEQSKSSSSPSSSSQSSPASLAEMQQMYSDVLEIVVSATLKVTAAQLLDIHEQGQARNLLTQVQALTPEIEKYLPARAAAVRAKLAQFDKAFYRPPTPPEPFEELEKKNPDELVAMAAKSPEEIKESLYRQAIAKAMELEDPARARQIAKDFLPNGGLGDPMVAEIEQKEREQALKQGKFEEARKSLARLRSDEERALALVELAVKAETNKDQKTQRQLLEEAGGLLGDQMDTRMQVEAQLALAIAYLNIDADRSFEILGSAIDRLNTVLGAVMVLTRFDQGGLPFGATSKEGEMRLNAGEFGNVTTNLDQRIVAFARKDFDRTVAALKRWEVNEIRLAMNLMLASSILGENKEAQLLHPFFGERVR
jgi:hypothetical protein